MAEGQQLEAVGRLEAARERYAAASRLRDDLPNIWLLRARNAIALGQYADALSFYRSALDQDQSNAEALNALAQLSAAAGDTDRAKGYAEQLQVIEPGNANAALVLGTVAFRGGRLDDAMTIADKLLAINSQNNGALLLRGRIEMQRGDIDAAAKTLALVESSGAKDFDSLRDLEQLFELRADGPGLLRVARSRSADERVGCAARLDLSRWLFALGRRDEGIVALAACFEADHSEAQVARFLKSFADSAIAPSLVIDAVTGMTRVQPALLAAIARFAVSADPRRARSIATFLARRIPLSQQTASSLGMAALTLALTTNDASASELTRSVLSEDKSQPDALLARSLVGLRRGLADAAIRDASIVIRDAPGRSDAIEILAAAYRQKGNPQEASRLTAAAADHSDDIRIVEPYVTMLLASNRYQDAKDQTGSFTTANPSSIAGWTLRSNICTKTGDVTCARRAATVVRRLRGAQLPVPATPPTETRDAIPS